MPNTITNLPDGKIEVKYDTGEVFSGDPMEVTQKLADAREERDRSYRQTKQRLESLEKAPVQPPPAQPPVPADELQLRNYLLEQQAKALGFDSAEAYKAQLATVVDVTQKMKNQQVASDFMNTCQDFPNTPEAIASLTKKVEEMGWNFDTQSMIAAHSVLTREHAQDATKGYAPLSPQQVNETWARDMQQANRQAPPPPMLNGRSPDAGQQGGDNPYAMDIAKLRAEAIRQQLGGQ